MQREIDLIAKILDYEELGERFLNFNKSKLDVLTEFEDFVEKKTYKEVFKLKSKRKKVIYDIFYEGKSLETIAKELKVDIEKVLSIKEKALKQLREKRVFQDIVAVFTGENLPLDIHKYFSYEFNQEMFKVQMKVSLEKLSYETLNYSFLEEPVSFLNFSTRVSNCLANSRKPIVTVRDLTECTEKDLKDIRNLGEGAKKEIIDKLLEYGLKINTKEGA